MAKRVPDFHGMLKVLLNHEIEFIVVGGVCAVLHGAPITTFDLDVVHSRDPKNLRKLVSALQKLDAYSRIQPERRLRPHLEHLSSPGHHLLMTSLGPLDLLGTIGSDQSYEDLLRLSVELQVGMKLKVRVLNLDALIKFKDDLAGDKDKAMLPILRQTLKERSKR